MQNVGADPRDTIAVFCGEQRRAGVIEPNGDIPTTARLAAVQVNQKPRGVVCVGGRIESFLHRGEGVGIVMKIDLHASDIDEAMVNRLLS